MTPLLLLALIAQPDFAALERSTGAHIGVSIRHIESGRVWNWRGEERFPTMSVYKYPIAIAVLKAVDAGKLSLDTRVTIRQEDIRRGLSSYLDNRKLAAPKQFTVRELLSGMVSHSDNTACDTLLDRIGGPAEVTRVLRALGITGVRVDRSEFDMGRDIARLGVGGFDRDGRDSSSPVSMASLLEMTHRAELQLKPESQRLLMRTLRETATGANRIKAGLPPGTPLWHKTGTGPRVKGVNLATNDVGVFTLPDGTHAAIAVFLKSGTAPDAKLESAIAQISREVMALVSITR
ncbi:MAG TPA: class A beta-lactamase [Bryobacteraceae bacterium]|nr:class A beta-lactamase [Bryobacteraceae bacterium]